jgi:hypothetical protein
MSKVPINRGTNLAAKFLVAAELERKGYDVEFTNGRPTVPFHDGAEAAREGKKVEFIRANRRARGPDRTPIIGLKASRSAKENPFWIRVKGQRAQNPWWAKREPERPNLFYVLVFVGETPNLDRFFILNQSEYNDLIEQFRIAYPNQTQKYDGFNWGDPERFKDNWQKLPGWT